MEDNELLRLLLTRSEQAIPALQKQYGAYCRAVIARVLPQKEDREECLNDVWLKVWETIPPQKPDRLGAYVARIARNNALSRIRKSAAQKRGGGAAAAVIDELAEVLPALDTVEEALDQSLLRAVLNDFLKNLPARERRIFVQRYWYLCSVKEIARNEKARENTVKTILFRTRAALRDCLMKEELL